MKKIILSLMVALGLCGCVSKSVTGARAPSAEGVGDEEVGDEAMPEYSNHPEVGVKLNKDSPFCDKNNNGEIDADEISKDNLISRDNPCERENPNTIMALKPISSFNLKRGQLVLTVDDGPSKHVTPKLLELFAQYGIKATFFMVGTQVKNNEELVREMGLAGHTLANHTYDHDIKHITPNTIVDEVSGMHRTLVNALGGEEPEGRLLFRAPGLAWSEPKGLSTRGNALTRKYIGPIHANLGADQPGADWYCWGHSTSAEDCADLYFQQIVETGRGVILSHDIYYKSGKPNSYEMWKILLRRLHDPNEGGGITNAGDPNGVWTFVNLAELSVLDQYDGDGSGSTTPSTPVAVSPFKRTDFKVRRISLKDFGHINPSSEFIIGGKPLMTGDITKFTDLNSTIIIDNVEFRLIRIEGGPTALLDPDNPTLAYVGAKAF